MCDGAPVLGVDHEGVGGAPELVPHDRLHVLERDVHTHHPDVAATGSDVGEPFLVAVCTCHVP